MKRIILSLCALMCQLAMSAGAIGDWSIYPAFVDVKEVETAGKHTFVLASGALYSYNSNDQSITTYDKAKNLSDCGITHIAWCQAAKRLVITYANQNIDLLDESGNVTNIPDYKLKTMTVDKTINGVNIVGRHAYLSTAFGIVKVNVAEGYINDTYNIGVSVNWTHVDSEWIYAESKKSGQYAALLSSNLLDKANWKRMKGFTAENKGITAEQMEIATNYRPEGPMLNEFGYMRFINNRLYSVPGFYPSPSRKAYVQIKDGDSWNVITNDIGYVSERDYLNAFRIEVDPKDENHWFVAARTGLYEYFNGKVIKEYYCDNSPLQSAATVPITNPGHVNYTLATSAIFDDEDNLWVFNGIAQDPAIYLLDKEGEWTTFPHPEMLNSDKYSWERQESAFFDSRGLLWFVNNDWRTPVLAVYNTKTDELRSFASIDNQDGTKVNFIYGRCCAEDMEHNIWFGTNIGPVVYMASDIEGGREAFQQIKVPRNDGTNLADYLLSGVDITCIAIDGGNRKWFGTNGQGVYLIDADNISQIQHFTSSNSPLLSDNIESITIDDAAGEVYFGTDKGLCSYTSDASGGEVELDKDKVFAYPNPMNPDYDGVVTISGLTYRSEVKISTASGQVVAEGVSNGGTFTWDGCDMNGQRVASGIYMVMVATEEGKKGVVAKIAVVR